MLGVHRRAVRRAGRGDAAEYSCSWSLVVVIFSSLFYFLFITFFYQNCCGCPLASTSPVNPNWVGIITPEVCFSRVLGLARRIGWSVTGIMELVQIKQQLFRQVVDGNPHWPPYEQVADGSNHPDACKAQADADLPRSRCSSAAL